jgi:hypothetical protein
MDDTDDEQARLANDLRKELVKLKVDTLKAQSLRMGLILPGDDVSATAFRKIQDSVIELNYAQLQEQIVHWTELSRKAAKGQ